MGLTYIKSRFLHPVKMKWYDLQIEIIGAWKFFLKRQRSGERKLTKIHYQSTDKICGNKRSTVIYMANGCLRTVGNGGFLWMCIVLRSRIWWNNYPTCRESAQNLHKD